MPRFNKIRRRWAKLRYWQKGAILGGGLHLVVVLLILVADLIFVPGKMLPGSGDMGSLGGWILFFLYSLAEVLPLSLLYLITGKNLVHPVTILREANWAQIGIWVLYVSYATVVYGILGAIIGLLIESFQKTKGMARNDK